MASSGSGESTEGMVGSCKKIRAVTRMNTFEVTSLVGYRDDENEPNHR